MIRAYSLQDYEQKANRALEEERHNLMAQIGMLTLDLEAARARKTELDANRRSFVAMVAQRHKLTDYRWLRIENNQLIGDIVDPMDELQPAGRPQEVSVNGNQGD